ncbi:MAG: hypothetical protein UX91_C0003G0066 [Candidatus Amesbacteria bacterium GW2011_GWB1_47_19]|nr:MAG: hypothetical protein UW51_C0003G0072 [Candidatus Amesbacteria bacterium GW2011_GWA1_44_24]KKU31497.1 MAG: hypothetical protein UX46_C0005G0066 [Candidatus Amesbacteria bacterium GW2011_GWC1_46_24]KKU67505.1 MAG: hypothetical protein UX91_C0003G0066 [Candidatus Amesbacteria bacterium GW2011_GWB1_47_19]OGD05155.1 MAG: hypothetical protein A2379_05270 [Candidatus Amesbacteria bacterium RIFOXYB1_FULL_47_13]
MAKSPKIVTIGGGTGAPTVIRALLLAGFSDISAISASTDSGGKTGQLRTDERDRVIAISDLLRNLLALISPRQKHLEHVAAFTDLLGFTDGRNRNLGYTLYYALLEKYDGDFLAVQNHLERLLGAKFAGTAIPVTLQPTHISFSTQSGAVFHGEHELDRQTMSRNAITGFWLDGPAPASPQAISAIRQATHIIYCPGSIYGSVLVNFLARGISPVLKSSKAVKILIANLVSNRNQTHEFTPTDYFRLFAKYTRLDPPFNLFLCPDTSRHDFEIRYPEVAANYGAEHSHFLGWDKEKLAVLKKFKITPVPAEIFSVTPEYSRLRHDPVKLAKILKQVIHKV